MWGEGHPPARKKQKTSRLGKNLVAMEKRVFFSSFKMYIYRLFNFKLFSEVELAPNPILRSKPVAMVILLAIRRDQVAGLMVLSLHCQGNWDTSL